MTTAKEYGELNTRPRSVLEYPPRNHHRMQVKAVCGVCLEAKPITQVAKVRGGYRCIPCGGRMEE